MGTCLSQNSVMWGDIVTSPLRALHTAGLASPLPASLPSVLAKGLVQEQSPTGWEPCRGRQVVPEIWPWAGEGVWVSRTKGPRWGGGMWSGSWSPCVPILL